MSKPTLFSLFKRGRFFRAPEETDESSDSGEGKAVRRECERFGMTAIGLVLKYDLEFRLHFLKTILRVGDQELITGFEVEVEPCRWADLRIGWTSSDGRWQVGIVEGKIGAELQPKQNFQLPEFVGVGGYGRFIREAHRDELGGRCSYVVLSSKIDLTNREIDGINCRQSSWEELERGFPNTEMSLDLAECLGHLGIRAFCKRKTMNMNLTADMGAAAKAWEILADACNEARIQAKHTKPDIGSEADGWHFGWSLSQKDVGRIREGTEERVKGSVDLTLVVQPKAESPIGWIGYESDGSTTKAAVWFYCGNQEAEQRVKAQLHQMDPTPDADHSVVVHKQESCTMGDREWFVEVSATVGNQNRE